MYLELNSDVCVYRITTVFTVHHFDDSLPQNYNVKE